jgi:hypothetical protein
MANLLHSVSTFKVAPLWCFEANSFNPASKYILIKTGKTFFKICQSPGYGILDGQTENTDMTDGQPVIDEWKQICENKDKVFSVFTDEILQEFHACRMEQSAEK